MIDTKMNVKFYDPQEGMELVILKKGSTKDKPLFDHVWAGTDFDKNITKKRTQFTYGSREYDLAVAYALANITDKGDGCYLCIAPRK